MKYQQKLFLLVCALCLLSACSATSTQVHREARVVTNTVSSTPQIPGVVEYVWEEPMTDVIDVPPGLDPEGHYYRPSHQEVVEIRQGRWKHYKTQAE